MSEAEAGLPTTEAALELSKARLDGMSGATQESAEPVTEQPGDAEEAAGADSGANPAGEPEEKPKADWSFVSEPALRAGLEGANLPPEVHSKFRDWVSDYTRKTQAAKAVEEEARAWRDVVSDPDLIGALKSAYTAKVSGKKPEPEAAKAPFKWATATEAEIEAEMERRIEAKAATIAKQTIEAEVKAPQTRQQQVVARAEALYAEVKDSMTPDQFRSAFGAAVQHYGREAFTPDTVERLFRPFLDIEKAKAEVAAIKAASKQSVTQARKATSPAGSAAPVNARVAPAPKVEPDGDYRKAREETKAQMAERLGLSIADLERAARLL